MKKVRKNILRRYNAFIAWGLSIFGIACTNIACEYGTPEATFIVTGKIRSETTGQPIGNIRVILDRDTVYSKPDGSYLASTVDFPMNQTFDLGISDVDNAANGSFQPKDTVVVFEDPEFKNGDNHWYSGETSKTVDIRLADGPPVQPPFRPVP
jgi:putative lipoprotein (rSAM/lipoprotein system)